MTPEESLVSITKSQSIRSTIVKNINVAECMYSSTSLNAKTGVNIVISVFVTSVFLTKLTSYPEDSFVLVKVGSSNLEYKFLMECSNLFCFFNSFSLNNSQAD